MEEPNDLNPAESSDGKADDPYVLEDAEPTPPPLPGRVITAYSCEALLDRIAADLVIQSEACMRKFGDFHLALSTDDSLELLYQRLMFDPNYRRLPWRRTHLWQVAEQAGAARGFEQVHETIVEHADIPSNQVHSISMEPVEPAVAYEKELCDALAWREKGHDRLDFVLVVLNESGSIAGIETGGAGAIDESLIQGGIQHAQSDASITMTLKLINAARCIAVLATGAACAPVIQQVGSRRPDCQVLTIADLAPIDGQLTWYLDADACRNE